MITLEEYKEALKIVKTYEKQDAKTLNSILHIVSERQNISINDMRSKKRNREIVVARQLYCHFAKEKTNHSLFDIGFEIRRDHATVLYSINIVKQIKEVSELLENYEI